MKPFIFVLAFIAPFTSGSMAQSRHQVSPHIQNEIIQQLTRAHEVNAECVSQAGGPQKTIHISSVDLNRDGKPEFVVRLLVSCGAGDGYVWIYRRTSIGLEELLSAGGPRTQVSPLKSYTNGYRDIGEDAVGSVSGDVARTIYKFDGKRYWERK